MASSLNVEGIGLEKMVNIKVHYICDLCGDEVCLEDNKNVPKWVTPTEVGDLCPACLQVWEKEKKDFVKKIKEFDNEPES